MRTDNLKILLYFFKNNTILMPDINFQDKFEDVNAIIMS